MLRADTLVPFRPGFPIDTPEQNGILTSGPVDPGGWGVSLAGFLESRKVSVLDGIEASGDSPEKLYAPKTLRDSKDRSQNRASVRMMAAESADGHEPWLTVWSRDTDEIGYVGPHLPPSTIRTSSSVRP